MNRPAHLLNISSVVLILSFSLPAPAAPKEGGAKKASGSTKSASVPTSALWREQSHVASLDLRYGPGGKEHEPGESFTFVKEDTKGGSPKFEVIDAEGVSWKAKLGAETKSETAATRLLWAAGYFTDEDYYVAALRVAKMPALSRGREFVSADGVVHGVRLERKLKGEKKNGTWSWFKNPFVGTKELSGLRIMMALINNWDLKEVNNELYEEKGDGPRYLVSDLGATFGETGNTLTRSKGNAEDYSDSKFIQKVTSTHVDFFLSSRPVALAALDVPYYRERTRMQDIVKEIPLAHVRWLGKLLQPLSDEQIRDCFRGAGFSPEDVEINAAVVKERIKDLNLL